MGEITPTTTSSSKQNKEEVEQSLELDVRETLKAMKLPISPEGAKEALVQIGRWSENTNDGTKMENVIFGLNLGQ
jgi:hypothetical protein